MISLRLKIGMRIKINRLTLQNVFTHLLKKLLTVYVIEVSLLNKMYNISL